MNNILVVDDEKEIREIISINLKNEGYNVLQAKDGVEALVLFENFDINLVILDIMMPKLDGIGVCRKIRESSNVPILMLSAKSENMDKIEGLLTGADDYIVKPFDSLELLVRIKALLRRAYFFNKSVDRDIIQVESLIIDKGKHNVTSNGEEINLTAREFEILYLLCSNRGRVFSTEEIFERVWEEDYFQSNNTVMVHMSRLRDKLNKATKGEKIIHTVWGVGYKVEK
ncbi:MAG: response regulator transcription factor [Clostridium sp.]|uniref:response regulator transcription factor n=1 Tax=Clostridium TaxID=1485 RepID=UPI0021522158|nr:response regulator transcription factor [Clostridium sp. LY3-2]MCR6515633.1 response regulator transcription factor [Clostridium sp. LY3-2]